MLFAKCAHTKAYRKIILLHYASNGPYIHFITVTLFAQNFWSNVVWSSTKSPTIINCRTHYVVVNIFYNSASTLTFFFLLQSPLLLLIQNHQFWFPDCHWEINSQVWDLDEWPEMLERKRNCYNQTLFDTCHTFWSWRYWTPCSICLR